MMYVIITRGKSIRVRTSEKENTATKKDMRKQRRPLIGMKTFAFDGD